MRSQAGEETRTALLRRRVRVARELLEKRRKDRLACYLPYPKQLEFHAPLFRERLLIAGNQVGKTYGASYEVAMHMTGRYPVWWRGKRFDHPVLVWTGSETSESSKELIQPALLGTEEADMKHPDMGTGAIPGELIRKVTTRQAGVKGVVNEIIVRHVSGKDSRAVLKTYDQGRTKWQGKGVHVIWLDEEPEDQGLYTEAVTRTQRTGGIVFMTFTPLLGRTPVVESFLKPKDGEVNKHATNMTIYDAMHYTEEQADAIVAGYEDWERDTRAYGIPMAGEGRVFRFADKEIECEPFQIPHWFRQIAGCDFGVDHPAAGCWLAHDTEHDIVYVTSSYRKANETSVYHAQALKARGAWIPISWPHDGLNRDKGNARPLYQQYAAHGAAMLPESARYEDDKGGSQPIEPAVVEIIERVRTGRFKVFPGQTEFMEEWRSYHRKDGKIVAYRDDIMSALRVAIMMLRYATTHVEHAPGGSRYKGSILS